MDSRDAAMYHCLKRSTENRHHRIGRRDTYLVIKLPKNGDLGNYDNYKDITLLSILSKIFNRILLEQMRDSMDPKLRDNQAGFM